MSDSKNFEENERLASLADSLAVGDITIPEALNAAFALGALANEADRIVEAATRPCEYEHSGCAEGTD